MFKAFWLAHLYFYRDNPGVLTTWPVVRMPNGPGIDQGLLLLHELADEGRVSLTDERIGPLSQKYVRLQGSPSSGLSATALAAVGQAVGFVKSRSATELSDLSHEHSRSWQATKNGDELDIYSDLMSDDDYSERMAALKEVSVEAIFK